MAPPDRHYGHMCCKCQAVAFEGRRYACWICVDYHLCGRCYDAGNLPITTDHKYFHPLEVHYTRAEFELYFGGESFGDTSVLQSYKCAICGNSGFSHKQLYKHLSEMHRNHVDFTEYFSILYTRYKADATSRMLLSSIEMPTPRSAASTSAFLRNMPHRPVQVMARAIMNEPARSPVDESGFNFREAVRLTQVRRAALLERQTLNVMEEMRMSQSNSRQYADQCLNILVRPQDRDRLRMFERRQINAVLDGSATRTVKKPRVRGGAPANSRLGSALSSPVGYSTRQIAEDEFEAEWLTSQAKKQRQHTNRALMNFGKMVRDRARETGYNALEQVENVQPETVNPDLNKFLCVNFSSELILQNKDQKGNTGPSGEIRMHFIEAILCSMLADEQLSAVNPHPVIIHVKCKSTKVSLKQKDEKKPIESGTTVSSSPPPVDIMERFYKGLNNYNKWLAEFTIKKLAAMAVGEQASAVPDMILQSNHEQIVDFNADFDADIDDRDVEEDEAPKNDVVEETTEAVAGAEAEAEDEDDDEDDDDDEDEDQDDDNDDDDDDEDDDFDTNTGSETSDSTIAILVNEIEQAYNGY